MRIGPGLQDLHGHAMTICPAQALQGKVLMTCVEQPPAPGSCCAGRQRRQRSSCLRLIRCASLCLPVLVPEKAHQVASLSCTANASIDLHI